ncbi:predicted protein [Plenodomus lingam JN3]|uniref:Predicted protein n=1 Tax=Leptosphaeria maculans (strain JN3 / isolate v23.1.3 / race Av1-4-5-6-7-8) TaxID=985895 RepID=E4ZRV3_LEPMJ|nr:predicted protein [Plenodomus lingam JN3]CBX93950.1 predicted protein [Plenodomus lingam JN3]
MPSQRLSLASFEDFAGKKLSGPIAIFQDSKQYTFERKKPVNGHPVHPAKMLLVGRYHTQYAAFPNVWAHTVGAGITYYLSLPGTSLAKLAPDPARIYFTDEPFSRMVGGKEDEVLYTAHHAQRGYIPGTNKWRSVIEAAITFIFLKTGHLKYAYVADANGMLSNFRIACMYFARNTSTRCSGRGVKQGACLTTDSSTSKSSGSVRVKVEREDSGDEWNVDEIAGSHYSSKTQFHQKHKPQFERPRLRPNPRQRIEQHKGKSVYTPCCGLDTVVEELEKECRVLRREMGSMRRKYKEVVRMLEGGGGESLGGEEDVESNGDEDKDTDSDGEDEDTDCYGEDEDADSDGDDYQDV